MSKLIMFNLVTIDGFFDGAKSWELDWHGLVVDQEFERFAIEQLRSADRLLFDLMSIGFYWSLSFWVADVSFFRMACHGIR